MTSGRARAVLRQRTRTLTVVVALAAAVALVTSPSALAAYSSARLSVVRSGTVVTLRATVSSGDDATASVQIFAPAGSSVSTGQTPGTVLGPVDARVAVGDLGGQEFPIQGELTVATPGQVPAAEAAACLQGVPATATWLMSLSAAGQTFGFPMYVVATPGAASPAYLRVCLPAPDLPEGDPSRAPLGVELLSAELVIRGVFGPVASGAWVSVWTPYAPGAGTPDPASAVAAPAIVAPGRVALTARARGIRAVITGRVTQAGQGRAGAIVTVFGGPKRSALTRLGRVRTKTLGTFAYTARAGTFFRVSASAGQAASRGACDRVTAPSVPGIPCVNPTISGFTAVSAVVRKR